MENESKNHLLDGRMQEGNEKKDAKVQRASQDKDVGSTQVKKRRYKKG